MSHNEDDTRDGTDGSVSGSNGKTPEQETRRRLLKAAAMAPVIYTVGGAGAAQAMTSAGCPTKLDSQRQLRLPGSVDLVNGDRYGDVCEGLSGNGQGPCEPGFEDHVYYAEDSAWVSAQCWTSFVTSSISAKTRIV